MTLSRRTMLATGGALLGLVVALYVAVSSIMLSGFKAVEARTTATNVDRAVESIQLSVDTLATKLADWSTWDDTCEFVDECTENDAEYIASNLTPNSLASLHLASAFFLRPDRSLAHAVTLIGEDTITNEPPAALFKRLFASPTTLVQGEQDGDVASGLVVVDGEIFAIASRPILASDGSGPSHGILVFCERIDAARIVAMGQRLRMDIALTPLSDRAPEHHQAPAGSAQLPAIERLDEQRVRGSITLPDIDGNNAFALSVTIPRFVYQEALASTRLIATTLAIAAVVCVSVTLLVLRFTVLGRLARLHQEVERIGTSGDVAARVSVVGHDELSHLALTLNSLLERIAQAHSDLASAKSSAERANLAKSEFLANMSHEVRTPLTAILGFSDLLAEQLVDDRTASEQLDTVRRNARHLLAVINDILDLSKIEAGHMDVEPLPSSPIVVVNEVMELLQEKATQKGLALTQAIEGSIPSLITTDAMRFRQILLNLTGNAIKFTEQGSVTLRLQHDRERGQLIVDVIDTGIGITTEQAGRLFSAFRQASKSISRVYGGTGLGLTISRRLAELLGGSLTLHATGATGSIFRLSIATGPLGADVEFLSGATELVRPTVVAAPPSAASQERALVGRRVLLAEDGPDNQRLIGFVLRKAGATVDVVGDGQQAIDAVLKARSLGTPYDLVLMDIQMPHVDGFAAVRALRSATVAVPILALTAHAMEGDRAACLDAGCNEYASKPIDRSALIDACRRLTIGIDRGSERASDRKAA